MFAASDDEKKLWLHTFKWVTNENKKMELKIEDEQDIARKFQKLNSEEKAGILQMTYKLKDDLNKQSTPKKDVVK